MHDYRVGEGRQAPTLPLRDAPPIVLHAMDKPTLCAHDGSGAGYGMDLALAAEIAADAPLAVQGTQRMMRMGLDETFETHVHHVYLQLLSLFGSDDFREGMAAFMEKRAAEFRGR